MGGGAARAEAHEHGAAQGRTSRQRTSVNFPRSGSERRRANIKKISSRRVRSGSSITKAMTAALYKKARTKCACILDFADRIEGSGLFADKASTSIAKLCRADFPLLLAPSSGYQRHWLRCCGDTVARPRDAICQERRAVISRSRSRCRQRQARCGGSRSAKKRPRKPPPERSSVRNTLDV
jgi:hypothetical protein